MVLEKSHASFVRRVRNHADHLAAACDVLEQRRDARTAEVRLMVRGLMGLAEMMQATPLHEDKTFAVLYGEALDIGDQTRRLLAEAETEAPAGPVGARPRIRPARRQGTIALRTALTRP